MKVEVDMQGLSGVLETLKQLPPEVVSKKGGPVRRALRKGAMVIVKEAKGNFVRAVAEVGKSGLTDTTGFTESQITAKRRTLSQIKGERYVVTVNGKPHPNGHKYRGRPIQANDIAFIMEAGGSKQPATPWLRPAFLSKAEEAIRTTEAALIADVDRIVRRLSAGKA